MTTSIDLRQFRYFLALSEELNFRRAALRLHISQPPLSRQIQQLEEQLGVELFQRNSSGVTLTQAGTAFLPEVRRTLAQADKAIAVRQRFPQWSIESKGKHSISLVRDIRSGAMDAALIGLHTDTQGLKVEMIFDEPYVLALPAGHRLARKRLIGFDELRGEPMFW